MGRALSIAERTCKTCHFGRQGSIISQNPLALAVGSMSIAGYSHKKSKTLEDILDFHVKFEKIYPFQDGNGRVGRLIMLKECLKYNIVPFIIEDNLKMYYYRGLQEWERDRAYLVDTCLTAQDRYKEYLDYFRIAY